MLASSPEPCSLACFLHGGEQQFWTEHLREFVLFSPHNTTSPHSIDEKTEAKELNARDRAKTKL